MCPPPASPGPHPTAADTARCSLPPSDSSLGCSWEGRGGGRTTCAPSLSRTMSTGPAGDTPPPPPPGNSRSSSQAAHPRLQNPSSPDTPHRPSQSGALICSLISSPLPSQVTLGLAQAILPQSLCTRHSLTSHIHEAPSLFQDLGRDSLNSFKNRAFPAGPTGRTPASTAGRKGFHPWVGNSDSWCSKQRQKTKQNRSLCCPASSSLRSPSPRDLCSLLTVHLLLKDALRALSMLVLSWVPSPTCWACGRTADPQAGVVSLPPVPWGRAGAPVAGIPTLLQLLPVCRWWMSRRSCCRYHTVLFRIFFSCLSQKPDHSVSNAV